tara:strand:- start:121 stop:354 length:234 start_codon:yes stop_codon:yes gene_type:complete
MRKNKVGDLVHIPQASRLVYFSPHSRQAPIPWNTVRLEEPKVAIVSGVDWADGYVQIIWNGKEWSVREQDIYTIKEL